MTDDGFVIDWTEFEMAQGDRMMELLAQVPREYWSERQPRYGDTLLHIACRHGDIYSILTLLSNKMVNVNATTNLGGTPLHWIIADGGYMLFKAHGKQRRIAEILLASGANARILTRQGYSPLDYSLSFYTKHEEVTQTLLANGSRLSTVHPHNLHRITHEMREFERGVLRCRSATVAFIRLKKAANWFVDKYLIREIAICIWATRYEKEWRVSNTNVT